METKETPTTIYAEGTPNPASMKFVANRTLLEGSPVECTSIEQTKNSPLAAKLFQFPFVTGVFILNNFVTVTKSEVVEWNDIYLELREVIQNYLSEGNPVVTSGSETKSAPANMAQTGAKQSGESLTEDKPTLTSETDQKISGILDEYIRPAVEQDGGAINFKSFKDGIVTVVLRGSCSGCPSSTMTLKAGIEGLLKRLVPEVKEVIAEEL